MAAPRSGGTVAPRVGVLIRGPFITDTPWKVPCNRAGRRRVINLIFILCQRERSRVASGSEGKWGGRGWEAAGAVLGAAGAAARPGEHLVGCPTGRRHGGAALGQQVPLGSLVLAPIWLPCTSCPERLPCLRWKTGSCPARPRLRCSMAAGLALLAGELEDGRGGVVAPSLCCSQGHPWSCSHSHAPACLAGRHGAVSRAGNGRGSSWVARASEKGFCSLSVGHVAMWEQ